MKCSRIRRYALGLTGLILDPTALVDRNCSDGPDGVGQTARCRGTGSPAAGARSRSKALTVPLFGGVELTGLAFGSPKSTDDPWLKAEKIRLNISVCDLFQGKIEPRSIEIDGGELRVLRRADGSLELSDFILPPPKKRPFVAITQTVEPERIAFLFHGATVTVIDEPLKVGLAPAER